MDWSAIITTLGSVGIGVGAAAWLAKKLLGQLLDKDLENFKASIKREGEREIESLKSSLQLQLQKQIIEYNALHSRRAEVISTLYKKLSSVHTRSSILPWQLQLREYKEEYGQQNRLDLEPSEQKAIETLSDAWRDMSAFYTDNKIYFTAELAQHIDRFQAVSGFVSVNYHNVAFKGEDGSLLVNPEVKRVWDASLKQLPAAMALLEREFREILGVNERPGG